ncbi:unnamed protein product [Eretmochelys imbricata]
MGLGPDPECPTSPPPDASRRLFAQKRRRQQGPRSTGGWNAGSVRGCTWDLPCAGCPWRVATWAAMSLTAPGTRRSPPWVQWVPLTPSWHLGRAGATGQMGSKGSFLCTWPPARPAWLPLAQAVSLPGADNRPWEAAGLQRAGPSPLQGLAGGGAGQAAPLLIRGDAGASLPQTAGGARTRAERRRRRSRSRSRSGSGRRLSAARGPAPLAVLHR